MSIKSSFFNIKYVKIVLICTFLLLVGEKLIANNIIQAEPLKLEVDFSQTTTPVQDGFQGYLAIHEDNNSFLPQKYSFGSAEVTIDVQWPTGTANTAKQMIDRGESAGNSHSDLLRDWIGNDGRSAKVPMTLTINGLPAGLYDWESFHHDNNDQTGIFNATINDASGSSTKKGIDISNGSSPFENITTFKTLLKSDGGDIVFSFEMDSYPGNSTSFFVMNGFSLIEEDTLAVPDKVELLKPINQKEKVSVNPVLNWTDSYYATEYKVFLSANNPPELIARVDKPGFIASSLSSNTTYYWSVEAINSVGGASSDIHSFTTRDSSSLSDPFDLKVDFGNMNSPVQEDYQGYLAEHENNSSFLQQTFDVAGLEIVVNAEWPSGTESKVKQMINRDENENEYSDLLHDWIGTDGREAQVPLVLTISGVPPGTYEWKSYHHDYKDQRGVFSATIVDAKGTSITNGINISSGNRSLENLTSFKSLLKSDGSDIVLSFEMDSYTETTTSFFVMNGFILTELDSTIVPDKVELLSPIDELKHVSVNPNFNWTGSFYANEYKLYLGTENPPQLHSTVEIPGFSASSLSSNTKYFWSVEAVNNNGGTQSEIRSFTTEDPDAGEFNGEMELTFSSERKFYDQGFELEITSNNPAANIIYTIDCSAPSMGNGKIYNKGITIDSTTIIKAIAISANDSSKVYTNSYLFSQHLANQPKDPKGFPSFWGGSKTIDADYEMDPEVIYHPDYSENIINAFQSLPSLSLTMDVDDWFNPLTGLYVGYPNSSVTVEKAVSAEFLFNDGAESFAINCGVQNQGGTSIVKWKVPKQSMRLLFKEEYGPTRLNYKLFPDAEIESINTLVIDGFLYSWVHPSDEKQHLTSLYFRDQLASDFQNAMGGLSFHGRYVHLFLNGLYWGMYDMHERPDDAFLSEYYDAEREDFDVIKHNPNRVVQGTNESYLAMLEVARKGLETGKKLEDIQEYLDLPSFIDYMILNFFLGNFDWAHQNYYAARNKTQQTGFKFYTWDAEHVMRYSDVNYNSTTKNNKGGPTEIHTFLKENEEYRLLFSDAVYKHFYNDGVFTPEYFEQKFLFRKNEIEDAIILESARWGDHREEKFGTTYTKNEHWIPEVNRVLEEYIPQRREIVIEQLRDGSNKLFPEYMPPEITVKNENSQTERIVTLENTNDRNGEIYFTTNGSDPRLTGGIINGEKYSGSIAINNSSILKTRFVTSINGNTIWSALAEKTFLFEKVQGEHIVINEIMYHPKDDYPEFIELYNFGEETINLNGFTFEKGIDFRFKTNMNIRPASGLVLTNDTLLFEDIYGFKAFGQYEKKLSNKGETIILKNSISQLVDSVSYSDSIPWPTMADGDGYSLELINSDYDNSLASSWQASVIENGTPYQTESNLDLNASVYPNPFVDYVNVIIDNKELARQKFVIEIYNQFGSKVKTKLVESYNSKIQIYLGNVSQGLYVIKIIPEDKSQFESINLKAIKL